MEAPLFEWDEKKNKTNIKKHGIAFEVAAHIFRHLHYNYDSSKAGEKRWVAIGSIEDIVIAVVYTVRHEKIRIISARKARESEKIAYCTLYARHAAQTH